MAIAADLIGKRFGKLTVLRRGENSRKNAVQWVCRCDCGRETLVTTNSLTSGNTKSCGCYRGHHRKHGAYCGGKVERLYRVWLNMKNRCGNPNAFGYAYYGGRGITVCEEWANDYDAFRKWSLENGYDPNAKFGECTIDRADNDKGYCPENCAWISMKKQCDNRRCTIFVTVNGERITASEASAKYGVLYDTLLYRHHAGWSDEDAVFGRKNHELNR